SSLFDFLTFGLMLWAFDAGPALFRSGWFVESLATQTLIIFVIRTRRPFWTSRPSRPLLVAALGVVTIGAVIPHSPLAHDLGFRALPATFFLALAAMVVSYLVVVELVKQRFFKRVPTARVPTPHAPSRRERRQRRRAARWIHHEPARSLRQSDKSRR